MTLFFLRTLWTEAEELRKEALTQQKISRVSTGLASCTRTEVGAGQRRVEKGSWGSELEEKTSASYTPGSPREG